MAVQKEIVVKMDVTAIVRPPQGRTLSRAEAIRCAMAAVSQKYETDIGPPGRIVWCPVFTDVTHDDCEIVETTWA